MRRRPNDDPLTRLRKAEEEIRKLKLAVFATPSSGGGGGLIVGWSPLSDIFAPASGVLDSYLSGDPRAQYAWDEDFFYLRGHLRIRSTFSFATGGNTLGAFSGLPWVASLPSAANTSPGTNNWTGPVGLEASSVRLGELYVSIPGSHDLTLFAADDSAIDVSGDNVNVYLDSVQLAWGQNL